MSATPLRRRVVTDAAALGTVLGVWAHPDDEVFLSAGLMAAASDAGHRVVCVMATLGQRGTGHPRRWPPDRLAAVRGREQHDDRTLPARHEGSGARRTRATRRR